MKKEVRKEMRGYFYDQHLTYLDPELKKELEALEYDKTPEEIALIENADREISAFMKKSGVKPFEVPIENIHIVPTEHYKKAVKEENVPAATLPDHMAIFFNAEVFRPKPLQFGLVAFHELFHLKGHITFEVEEKRGKKRTTLLRHGLEVYAPIKRIEKGEQHPHFKGLEEAITAEMEKRYFNKLINHPTLKDYKKFLTSPQGMDIKLEIAKKEKISPDEISEVTEKKDFSFFDYPKQRKVLTKLTQEIYQDNKNDFDSPDEALDLFVEAHFNGKLLPISRLIKKSFGEDALQVVGMMGSDENSPVQVMDLLTRMRGKTKERTKT
jgi:hypothetical protein